MNRSALINDEIVRRSVDQHRLEIDTALGYYFLVQRINLKHIDIEVKSQTRRSSMNNLWFTRICEEQRKLAVELYQFDEEANTFIRRSRKLYVDGICKKCEIVVHDDKIYCIGGRHENFTWINEVMNSIFLL